MASKVQVIEKNEGAKISWRQSGTKLIFGEDDDLIINCATRQKDWPVHADISLDEDGNLVVGTGRYYLAQVDIPAREYADVPNEDEIAEGTTAGTHPEPQPIDMEKVELTLWGMDGFGSIE